MQGVYYGTGDKPPEMKADPACVYLWVPFNLFRLNGWYVMWGETRLLLIVMLCGFLGAMIYSIRSFFWYTGHGALVWSWMAMYILLPVVGSMMAVVFYLVFRGGLFNPTTPVSETSPFGFAAIATLVGMFIQQAAMKLKDVFETLLTKGEHGENAVQATPLPAKPNITVTPINPPHNTDTKLTIKGEQFTEASKAFAGTTALTTAFTNDKELSADLPAALIPNAGSTVDITVQTGTVTTNAVTLQATPAPTTATAPAKPNITVTPAKPSHNTDTKLTITGEQFTAASKVFANTTALTTTFTNDKELSADLPAALIPSAGSTVKITVQTGAVTTDAVTLTAT